MENILAHGAAALNWKLNGWRRASPATVLLPASAGYGWRKSGKCVLLHLARSLVLNSVCRFAQPEEQKLGRSGGYDVNDVECDGRSVTIAFAVNDLQLKHIGARLCNPAGDRRVLLTVLMQE